MSGGPPLTRQPGIQVASVRETHRPAVALGRGPLYGPAGGKFGVIRPARCRAYGAAPSRGWESPSSEDRPWGRRPTKFRTGRPALATLHPPGGPFPQSLFKDSAPRGP